MDKQRIREKSSHDNTGIRLVERSKRGILHVLFGRTMLILVLFAVQILLLYMAFRSLRRFIPYIYGLLMVFYGVIIVRLVNKPSDASSKITWILLIVLLPPVGVALYLFAEFDLGHRMLNRRLSELIARTEPMQPDQSDLRRRLSRQQPELGALSEYMWRNGRFPTYENTQVEYLPSGEAALEAILREIDRAERFIFMEFFIVDEGVMWGRILEKLEEKIAQGVEVRLLYDGTCAVFRLPYSYPKMLAQLGIQCKMFSPLRPVISTHYNNRDHRKILVIDGRVAYTGGVNLADEYINRIVRFGHWKDMSVRLEGEAARSFTLMFLQMWNVDEGGDDYSRFLDVPAAPRGADAPGWVLPYGDSPLDNERVGEMVYIDILNRAAYRPEWNIYNKETEHPAPEGSVASFLLYTPDPDRQLFGVIVVSVNENGSAYFIDCKNGMGNLRNKFRVDEQTKQDLIQLYPQLKQA